MADIPRGRVTITLGRTGQVFLPFRCSSFRLGFRLSCSAPDYRISFFTHSSGGFCYCLLQMKIVTDFLVCCASYRIFCFFLDALIQSHIKMMRKISSSCRLDYLSVCGFAYSYELFIAGSEEARQLIRCFY